MNFGCTAIFKHQANITRHKREKLIIFFSFTLSTSVQEQTSVGELEDNSENRM